MTLDIGASVVEGDSGNRRRIDVALVAYNAAIWVEYDPTKYDWRIEHVLVKEADTIPAYAVKEFLQTFVLDWDLQNNGEPLDPQNPETYSTLKFFEIQMPIAWAIIEDMNEKKALPNVSQLPSSTASQPRRK